MAFSAITAAQIAAGEATKQELFNTIKDNFDDHESRITAVEAATQSFRPMEFFVIGQQRVVTQALVERINFTSTVLSARILLVDSGSSGTLEIDFLKKRGVGAFTSIFTTKPSLTSAAADFDLSTNQVLDAGETDLLVGDLIRLDITSAMTGCREFYGLIEFEAA